MDGVVLYNAALKIVPVFNGDPNKLYRFIKTGEAVLNQYYDAENPTCFSNTVILSSIIGKLEGKAEEVININGAVTWEEIKLTLIQNFADQRDENSLNRDLVNMRQRDNENAQTYYERCLSLLNCITNYVDLHETDVNLRICKRKFFSAQTLRTYLAGLKEPLGSTIRAMRPEDMPSALQFIKEEENIAYLQKKPVFDINSKHHLNSTHNQKPFTPFTQNQNRFNNQKSFTPFTQNQNQYNHKTFPNFSQNQFNRKPFTPFTQNQHQFGQRPYKPWNQQRPTPMSGVSHNTTKILPPNMQPQQSHPYNHFRNVGSSPHYVSKELHINETQDLDDNYCNSQQFDSELINVPLDEYYIEENTEENSNFPVNPDLENQP